MPAEHLFIGSFTWTGADEGPAETYASYSREWTFAQAEKPLITGSAAVPFRGVGTLPNPEDLLLASVSACHCLSFLALATRHGLVVTDYQDECRATMRFHNGKMRIVSVELFPIVTFANIEVELHEDIHHKAHEECFIANSVNFEITVAPRAVTQT